MTVWTYIAEFVGLLVVGSLLYRKADAWLARKENEVAEAEKRRQRRPTGPVPAP